MSAACAAKVIAGIMPLPGAFFLNLKMARFWQRHYSNHAEAKAKADITDYIIGVHNGKRNN